MTGSDIEDLIARLHDFHGHVGRQAAEALSSLRAENEELRVGLSFYADPANWIDTPPWEGDPECITPKAIPVHRDEDGAPCDCGDRARSVLASRKIVVD